MQARGIRKKKEKIDSEKERGHNKEVAGNTLGKKGPLFNIGARNREERKTEKKGGEEPLKGGEGEGEGRKNANGKGGPAKT